MGLFSSKAYSAEARSSEFVSGAELVKGSESESSHTLIIRFREPVRDGNQVSHFNILFDGQAVASDELFTGETKYSCGINPSAGDYSIVFADEDKQVLMTDEFRIYVE